MITRRNFIKHSLEQSKWLILPSFIPLLSSCTSVQKKQRTLKTNYFPLQEYSANSSQNIGYLGDNPLRAHTLLWDRHSVLEARKSELPSKPEHVKCLVLGGGLSGLSTAFLLKDLAPVILEQAPQFGGHSKGELWEEIPYSIGAAYFAAPEAKSPVETFLKLLGIHEDFKIKSSDDPYELNGKKVNHFWTGSTVPNSFKPHFSRLHQIFSHFYEGSNSRIYPDIPIINPEIRNAVNELDRLSIYDWIKKELHLKSLHPHLFSALEGYCWSSFGGSAQNISAASAINFLAGEQGGIAVFPGGNAWITQTLVQKLERELPINALRPQSIILDIQLNSKGVQVIYEDSLQKLKWIQADVVACSLPKFQAVKLVSPLRGEYQDAAKKLTYTPYLVANALLNEPYMGDRFYDLFRLKDATLSPFTPLPQQVKKMGTTDVVLANFAHAHHQKTVLTLYKPLPYPEARSEILASSSHQTELKRFESELMSEILPLLSINTQSLKSLRVARWGHALPVAEPNLIANGICDILRTPIENKIFWINQDNWALPAMETCIGEAMYFAPLIRKQLS